MHQHHGGGGGHVLTGVPVLALAGNPNSGKSSVFNGLTGLRSKTGNYPGVTVARYVGRCAVGDREFVVEDLPGTYSLEPISPDEQIVSDLLEGRLPDVAVPDALVAVVDATTLRRGLAFLSQLLQLGHPVCVAVTFTDELFARHGDLDLTGLSRALGVPAVAVVANRAGHLGPLRELLAEYEQWPVPAVAPPTDPGELDAWISSVLTAARYRSPQRHRRTEAVDRVLLHPVWGALVFFAVMFGFFQVIFTVAAPLQDYVASLFEWLSGVVEDHVSSPALSGLLGDALLGGVGGVLVFLPQILLLFLLISLMESVGYLSRAAFLMDRLLARFGLEGRAFVALLSSFACAVPGIMATRTMPSRKERIATMMAAPLMTCSARLPVYVLLIGILVPSSARVGPFAAQGLVMFGLYLLGAVSAMLAAWAFRQLADRGHPALPFYLEMPPYRLPTVRLVVLTMWESAKAFLRKVTTIIMLTTVLLWVLLNLPVPSTSDLTAAGVDPDDQTAVATYTLDHSYAASVGQAMEPVFAPLGFDWRINVAVLASLSARETFVATLGQMSAAADPGDSDAIAQMTYTDGPNEGELVLTPPTLVALLVFFVYALQCMSTVAIMRRESGSWKWPGIAFGSMFALAWTMALLAHTIAEALT
ncbi:MAG TPA: ferrous iron transporter B [Nocardioides sp.]|uniref:ferrous iron transporter B n=1 Tax=Nocardioides sp. TaxID=35761 RepID=UPI002CBB55CF|nr:ferrous iron transporter B [Nocardioides sp.]HQR28606.1 ferrous iron transporter B [Nocardioides sp.]